MNYSELLKPLEKSSIQISYDTDIDDKCPVGASKIGGKPDVPLDFEWYYFQGTNFDGETGSRPLSFIAQINCEEVNKYDKDNLLPSKGMLYFFYEITSIAWGNDPKDKGSAKVYYFPGSVSKLQSTDFPVDLSDELKLPEIPITFSHKSELPNFEEFFEWNSDVAYSEWDNYDDTKIQMGFDSDFDDEIETMKHNKLLGYADVIQSGMLLECECAANGICYREVPNMPEEKLRQHKENSKKWQLLFQLDSIETDNYEMLWGDTGKLYFYINIDDLVKLNFDNCWLILQCY